MIIKLFYALNYKKKTFWKTTETDLFSIEHETLNWLSF